MMSNRKGVPPGAGAAATRTARRVMPAPAQKTLATGVAREGKRACCCRGKGQRRMEKGGCLTGNSALAVHQANVNGYRLCPLRAYFQLNARVYPMSPQTCQVRFHQRGCCETCLAERFAWPAKAADPQLAAPALRLVNGPRRQPMRPRPPFLLPPCVNVHHALGHSLYCFCSSILRKVERVEQVGTLQVKGCSNRECNAFHCVGEFED